MPQLRRLSAFLENMHNPNHLDAPPVFCFCFSHLHPTRMLLQAAVMPITHTDARDPIY